MEPAFAAGAAIAGLYLFFGSFGISTGVGYDRIGPRFFPFLVAAGLLATGALVGYESIRRPPAHAEELDPLSFLFIVLALVLSVLLLERLGFILTGTLLFCLVARAFRSRRYLRNLGVGLTLSILVYFTFTSGLGLVLPRGMLAGLA